MAQDEVSLYNLALSAAGARSRISLPTENSREAEICRLWFAPTYRHILRAAQWSSARSVARLALITEQTSDIWMPGSPSPGYRFAYSLPDKCLRPRFLSSYQRFSVELISPEQQALMTDVENALLYFTYDQFRISMWDPSLYMAVAKALGAQICLPLNGKTSQARAAMQEANAMIYAAREAAANEDFEPVEAVPLTLQVRGSAYNRPLNPFVYPDGPILAVANV